MILDAKLIAEGWIDLRASKLTKQERALGDWANEALREAICNDADYAFEIIEAIHALDPDHKFVEEFAAGPVEDLLSYQGVMLIDRIEQKARRDKSFAFVLAYGRTQCLTIYGSASRSAVNERAGMAFPLKKTGANTYCWMKLKHKT